MGPDMGDLREGDGCPGTPLWIRPGRERTIRSGRLDSVPGRGYPGLAMETLEVRTERRERPVDATDRVVEAG